VTTSILQPLALILLAGPATASTDLSMGDGDTLRVTDGPQRLTLRRACIDGPETVPGPLFGRFP
jgi:endonuclease YncB( thermonuclease family)